jgi:hypothetical protein
MVTGPSLFTVVEVTYCCQRILVIALVLFTPQKFVLPQRCYSRLQGITHTIFGVEYNIISFISNFIKLHPRGAQLKNADRLTGSYIYAFPS